MLKFNYDAINRELLRPLASIFAPKKVNSLSFGEVDAIINMDTDIEAQRAALKAKLKEMTDAVAEAKAFYKSQGQAESNVTKGRSFSSDRWKGRRPIFSAAVPMKRQWVSDSEEETEDAAQPWQHAHRRP